MKKRDRQKKKTAIRKDPSRLLQADPMTLRTRLSGLLYPSLLLGLQIGLISGWNVYRGNQADFDHGLLDLTPFLLPVVVALTAMFWVLPALLPNRTQLRSISFLTMFGILLYVQGNFLVWDYGVFDGGEVPWARHQSKGWLETALWTGTLAWALFRPRALSRFSRTICLALIGLQIGSLMVTSFSSEEGFWHREGSFADMPAEEIYQYSQNRNVVHLVLDAFQTDVFMELASEENLSEELDGFLFFQDNLGVAAHTSFAMPAIFSGEIFDGNESPSSYYDRCINELGFPNQLYDQGYRVNLLPRLRMDKSKYNSHFRVPDTFGGSRGFRQRQAAGQLLDIGLFRQLPHYAKKWMHNNGQWRISGVFSTPPNHRSIHQREFLRDYISRIDPVLENPSYNFIHMMSPHPPYGVKADGSPSHDPMPLTRESYKHEARYSLRVFMDLLRRLKALDIYDDALIILQGDHGSDFAPVVEGRVRELPTKRAPTLLAIKAPQATGPLEISHIPSSIADVPATVADILGIGSNYPGVSLLDLDRDLHRPREFFHYLGRDRGNPALKRFIVDGPVFEAGSWREMGVVDVVQDASDYNWGELVAFGMEGNADAFTRGGWGAPFSNGQWSDGKRAHLEFQVADPGEDVVFLFSMRPFLAPGKLDQQRVTILVNEMNLATLAVTEPQPRGYVLTIPEEWIDSGKILITLELPDAAIPSELGVGEDNRMLGLSFISIWLFPESMKDEVTRRAAESKPSGEKNLRSDR